jgi:hypothetical protein
MGMIKMNPEKKWFPRPRRVFIGHLKEFGFTTEGIGNPLSGFNEEIINLEFDL